MQRDADDIFRVTNLEALKSPAPGHILLRGNQQMSPGAPSTPKLSAGAPIIKPTPKPMAPPPARPRPSPLASLMKTPSTSTPSMVTKTLLGMGVTLSNTPLANRSVSYHESSSLAGPSFEHLNLDSKIEAEIISEKERAETALFNDIVDESKFLDEKQDTELEEPKKTEVCTDKLKIEVRKINEVKIESIKINQEIPKVDEVAQTKTESIMLATPKRGRGRPPKPKPTIPLADSEVKENINLTNGVKKVAIKEDERGKDKNEEKKEETEGKTSGEKKEERKELADESKKDEKTEVIDESKKETSVAEPVKKAPISKDYTMYRWYLQRIPNNEMFSQVKENLSKEWIVLVGYKNGLNELWHSSIVSGRESETRIMTGSGRLYVLQDQDPILFRRAGFSKEFISRFNDGFPEDWKELVQAELNNLPLPEMKTPIKAEKTPTEKIRNEKTPAEKIVPVSAETPKTETPKRGRGRPRKNPLPETSLLTGKKVEVAEKTCDKTEDNFDAIQEKDDVAPQHRHRSKSKDASEAVETPKRRKQTSTITPGQKTTTPTPNSAPPARHLSIPTVDCGTPRILGSTRSGRKVITPIPFWDSKAISTFKQSPASALHIKRKWGNPLDL